MKDWIKGLSTAWANVAAATGILYFFGFLAYRARLNVLGVRTDLALVNQFYLTEGALFLSDTLETFLYPGGLVLAIAFTVLVAIEQRFGPGEGLMRRTAVSNGWRITALVVFWIATLCVTAFISRVFNPEPSPVVTIPGTSCPAPPKQAVSYHLYLWLAVAPVVLAVLARLFTRGGLFSALHAYLPVLSLFAVLCLPIAWGKHFDPAFETFHRVRVVESGEGAAPLAHEGVLLFESERLLVICSEAPQATYLRDKVRTLEELCEVKLGTPDACVNDKEGAHAAVLH